MKVQAGSLPDALNRDLSACSRHEVAGVALDVERGAKLVTTPAIVALQRLSAPLFVFRFG